MVRKIYSLFLLIACSGLHTALHAQSDPQFSMYMLNPVYYNPAAVGSEGVGRFQLVHRTQWAGYQGTFDDGGAPSTQLFSFNMPLAKYRSGIGVFAMNDRLGPEANQAVMAAYALRLPVSKGTLALGVQGGIYNKSIDYNRLRPGEPGDPLLGAGRLNQTRPDVSVGAQFSAGNYYIGASMQHISQPAFRLANEVIVNPLARTIYVTGGYRYAWNELIDFMPSAIYKINTSPDPSIQASSFEVNMMAMYDKRHWVGLGYRQQDAIMATLGVSLLRNNALRFGYSFDFITGGRGAKSPTSHELLLSYSLPEPQTGRKPIIRTPRFRY
ncbi:PorP/SprF family type IX secretion system membrane protein [Tellurirhabdus bombi]|uniref:PorP/SprF family type IX secretion system membrane protein n=1 Tax=Tellurirhabdus bombi TaxID=2907205 RepID=UPI001F373DB5|nr:type IX secretion system membrane protein PorP/SprF [Tellurirhabdus bombi]